MGQQHHHHHHHQQQQHHNHHHHQQQQQQRLPGPELADRRRFRTADSNGDIRSLGYYTGNGDHAKAAAAWKMRGSDPCVVDDQYSSAATNYPGSGSSARMFSSSSSNNGFGNAVKLQLQQPPLGSSASFHCSRFSSPSSQAAFQSHSASDHEHRDQCYSAHNKKRSCAADDADPRPNDSRNYYSSSNGSSSSSSSSLSTTTSSSSSSSSSSGGGIQHYIASINGRGTAAAAMITASGSRAPVSRSYSDISAAAASASWAWGYSTREYSMREYSTAAAGEYSAPEGNLGPSTSSSSSSSARWPGGGVRLDPEVKRQTRLAGYKAMALEAKLKQSLRRSFRWIKDKCLEAVHGHSTCKPSMHIAAAALDHASSSASSSSPYAASPWMND
jgi:hypothetical protein